MVNKPLMTPFFWRRGVRGPGGGVGWPAIKTRHPQLSTTRSESPCLRESTSDPIASRSNVRPVAASRWDSKVWKKNGQKLLLAASQLPMKGILFRVTFGEVFFLEELKISFWVLSNTRCKMLLRFKKNSLVVEPTQLNNMLVKLDYLPSSGRCENKNIWNHHLAKNNNDLEPPL